MMTEGMFMDVYFISFLLSITLGARLSLTRIKRLLWRLKIRGFCHYCSSDKVLGLLFRAVSV